MLSSGPRQASCSASPSAEIDDDNKDDEAGMVAVRATASDEEDDDDCDLGSAVEAAAA